MKSRKEKFARSITGKHATGPVRSMHSGGEADDQERGPRITESRNRFSPIHFVPIRAAPQFRNLLAVATQTRTSIAADDIGGKRFQPVPPGMIELSCGA